MQDGKTVASSSPSLQLHAQIYSPLFIPAFTTALQCPRSSAGASHVEVSIPATFMSRLHVSLYRRYGRPTVRVPVTSSPYNMSFGMRPLAILWTWPSHRKRRWLSSVYMYAEAGSTLQYLCVGNLVLPGSASSRIRFLPVQAQPTATRSLRRAVVASRTVVTLGDIFT